MQNSEGIARKAGNGRFPHLSHGGKNHTKIMFVAQNKYSSSDRVASDLATQEPGGEVIAVRTVRVAITCLKNWTTDTAALNDANKNAVSSSHRGRMGSLNSRGG